jgi:hypothetical protein
MLARTLVPTASRAGPQKHGIRLRVQYRYGSLGSVKAKLRPRRHHVLSVASQVAWDLSNLWSSVLEPRMGNIRFEWVTRVLARVLTG